MKKQLIVGGVTIVLILLGFSGCLENSNKDTENGVNPEVQLFIGRWRTTPYIVFQNGTRQNATPSNSTFYNNGTMGSEDSSEHNKIYWTPYIIENNQICFGEANASDYLCYYYEFSDNGTEAILMTYYSDENLGETYQIVIEMSKN